MTMLVQSAAVLQRALQSWITRSLAARGLAFSACTLLLFSPVGLRAQVSVPDCDETNLVALMNLSDSLGEVVFDEDCSISLSKPIVITNNTIINANENEVILTATNGTRLFTVGPGVNFQLIGLTLAGGYSTNGGGIYISPGATVILNNCTLTGNSAIGSNGVAGANGANSNQQNGGNGKNGTAGGQGLGGAIYNLGYLELINCRLLTNNATGGSGGDGGNGGNSTAFQGGNGGNGGAAGNGLGGAIYSDGELALTDCTFAGNSATGSFGGLGGTNGLGLSGAGLLGNGGAGGDAEGAGIYSLSSVTVTGCTFFDNSAHGGDSADSGQDPESTNGKNGLRGGDASGGGMANLATGNVINCTFANNSVTGGAGGNGGSGELMGGNGGNGGDGTGGALFNSGEIQVLNCTFANGSAVGGTNGLAGSGLNSPSNGTKGKAHGGSIANDDNGGGAFAFKNSLIATNFSGGNGHGTIIDDGNNISSDNSLPFSGSSLKNTDPLLDVLADNGGATLTMALLPDSPAIDAADDAAAPAVDQRGLPRPSGLASDIGAYEVESFLIQGQISSTEGLGLPGIVVVIGSRSTFTDGDGNYSLSVVPGTYHVRPLGTNYIFKDENSQPVEFITVEVIDEDVGDINFIAAQIFTMSGRVLNGTAGLSNVTMTLRNDFDELTVTNTDASGNYRFTRLEGGFYELTPARAGFEFEPESFSANLDANVSGLNFAAFPTYSISGRITNGASGVSGITVSANGESAVTDANGNYTIPGLRSNVYNVTPTSNGSNCYAFNPPSRPARVGPNNTNNVNFGATPVSYTISGSVTFNGNGLSGVTVNGGGRSAITDTNGLYILTNICSGTYSLTASLAGYLFTPPPLVTVGPNATNQNFIAVEAFSISGRILDGTNGVNGVSVQLGTNTVTTTVTNGSYTFSNLLPGTYVVTPTLSCYQFNPTNRTVQVGPSTNGVDFAAIRGFTVHGRITEGLQGVAGVSVHIGTNSATTDTNGDYFISGICAGTNSVVPSKASYVFEPSTLPILVGPGDNVANFTATRLFTLAGQVGITNVVSVTIVGGGLTNIVPTTNGAYSVSGLYSNVYTVTPTLACYQFQPTNQVVVLNADKTNVNFAVTHGFSISGNILDGANGAGGVSLTIVGNGTTNVIVTATNGSYSIAGLCAGSYSVTPTLACYQFTPTSQTVNVGPSTNNVNFTASHGFVVSGRITEGAQGLAGVSVVVGTSTNTTDVNGNYAVSAVCAGAYNIVPSLSCYQFYPSNQSVTVGPSVSNKDFIAFRTDVFTIRGRVTLDGTNGLAGVTVSNGNSKTNTDANGYYVLTRVCYGLTAVTPVLTGFGFAPDSRTLMISADTNGVDFVAFPAFSISGQIFDGTNGLTGVSVTAISSNSTQSTLTTNGSYTISGLRSNTYTVVPALSCYYFTASNLTVNVGPTNATANFAATHDVHIISGRVTEGAVGVAGIAVQAGGQSTNTDVNGYYAFSGLCPGSYTVIPAGACYQFFPISRNVTLGPDNTGSDFVAFRNAFTVRGRIVNNAAVALNGVTVSAEGQAAVTDTNGNYVLPCLSSGSHTLVPSLTGYRFAPSTLPITLASDTNGLDFTGFPALAISHGTNGLAQLLFWGSPAMNYRLEASTNLVNWETVFVTNNIGSSLSLFQFVDADSARFPWRFYRLGENLLLLLNRTGGSVRLSFAVGPERNYQLRASTNLVDWQIIFTTNFATTNLSGSGLFQFTDAEATNFPTRFYRLNRY